MTCTSFLYRKNGVSQNTSCVEGFLVVDIGEANKYFDVARNMVWQLRLCRSWGGEMYAVWDTALIQSGLKAKTMSFDAIKVQHAQGLLGLEDRSLEIACNGMLADLMHVTKPILAREKLSRESMSTFLIMPPSYRMRFGKARRMRSRIFTTGFKPRLR